MTMHLFGAVVTADGVAANNRGETEGNLTTLQKLLWNGDVYSTISAEAIRWAVRSVWQAAGLAVNRRWDEAERAHAWQDQEFLTGGRPYIDDDVLGFMSAQGARTEAGDEEAPPAGARRARPRGTVTVRRSRFEVTRAVSLVPWAGDVVFNAAGVGATPAASRTGRDLVPYSAEVHATRYQYGFALTPSALLDPARAEDVLDAVVNLSEVAGNQARFFFDFAPDALILRWSADPAPRILYSFEVREDGQLAVPELLRRARAGDVPASELVIGGRLADTDDGAALHELGATVFPGVKAAAARLKELLQANRER
jgi:CRISPR-associated protein Cst2